MEPDKSSISEKCRMCILELSLRTKDAILRLRKEEIQILLQSQDKYQKIGQVNNHGNNA